MGPALPDMPWEERPAGSKEVMWRYSANPIIGRDALSTSNSVFNSAVVPFKKGKYNYAGVFRCDDTNRRMRIHAGFSVDGIDWDIREEDFNLVGGDAEISADKSYFRNIEFVFKQIINDLDHALDSHSFFCNHKTTIRVSETYYSFEMKYFQPELSQGTHRIRVEYTAYPWRNCLDWITKYNFRYSCLLYTSETGIQTE